MKDAPPRLYIFDVDGTLRWTRTPGLQYPIAEADWELLPNVAATLRTIPWSESGPWLAVASNQSGVGEGLLTARRARAMIVDTIAAALGYVPDHFAIEMCVCARECPCPRKKPSPGMLVSLLKKFTIGAHQAVFVGDQPIDLEAAQQANIPFVWAAHFFRQQADHTTLETWGSASEGGVSTRSVSESQ